VTATAPPADLLMQPLPADLGLFFKLEDIAPMAPRPCRTA